MPRSPRATRRGWSTRRTFNLYQDGVDESMFGAGAVDLFELVETGMEDASSFCRFSSNRAASSASLAFIASSRSLESSLSS